MGTLPEKLPRARLVRRRAVFSAARERGRRSTNRGMTLSVLPRDSAQPANDRSEVAFLTPKRIGGAVVRNKLRRRMREIYRRTPQIAAPEAYLIWIARPMAVELTFEELRDCMQALLKRAGRL